MLGESAGRGAAIVSPVACMFMSCLLGGAAEPIKSNRLDLPLARMTERLEEV